MDEAKVFVKIDDYKDIIEVLGVIKEKLEEAKSTLGEIRATKNEEDSELELWSSTLIEIERKVQDVNANLPSPQSDR